jgi:cytoskeletal protein CcmA (bactofilin family)
MNHIDEMTCLLFLEGQLEKERSQEVTAHTADCQICRELLRAMESEGAWLRESLAAEEDSIPARLLDAPQRGGTPWGWITSLGLASGGAYTLWSGIIEPWQVQAAQAGFTQGNILSMIFFSGAFWKGWDAMRSLMEFMAMATLGIVLIWLLRRRWRQFTAIAFVMGALVLALAIPSPARASETKHGDPNYTLPSGEEIKTDLFVFGDSVRIDGTVDGDLVSWSRNITVTGHVKGDVLAFCQQLTVDGQVDGNVRTFAQSFTLGGTVARNVMSWSQESEFEGQSKVGGTATMGGADLQLNGQLGGDALLFGDALEINGSMGHDISAKGGSLRIGPSADVKGGIRWEGRRQPDISSSAKLFSQPQVTIKTRSYRPNYQSPRYYWHQVLFWGARFIFGLVLLLLAPGFFFDAASACKKYAPAFGFGALFLCATPIIAIIVCLTIVGLGVGISTALLYVVAVYSARVFVSTWLGEMILGPSAGVGPAVGRLALGLAIIQLLTMLPYAGFFIKLIAAVWGMGGLVLALYKHMRPQAPATAAVA